AEWIRMLYDQTRENARQRSIDLPEYERFLEKGWVATTPPEKWDGPLVRFRADPQAHPLPTPSGRIHITSEVVAGFGYDDCPGHAAWLEPREWLGARKNEQQLHLISNQ